MAHYAFNTVSPQASFVSDVTDTDYCAQNGNIHGRLFAALKKIKIKTKNKKCRFSRDRTRNNVKNSAVCILFLPFLSTGSVRFFALIHPLKRSIRLLAMCANLDFIPDGGFVCFVFVLLLFLSSDVVLILIIAWQLTLQPKRAACL